jgi:uncharacterized membrane protein
MVSLDLSLSLSLSLSDIVVVVKLHKKIKSMQANVKLLINMGIISWSRSRFDTTQPSNTPTARENFHMLYLRITLH